MDMGLSNLSDDMSEAFKRGVSIGLANSSKTPPLDNQHTNHSNAEVEQKLVNISEAPSYDQQSVSSKTPSALLALEYGDDNTAEFIAMSGSTETHSISSSNGEHDSSESRSVSSSNGPLQGAAKSQSLVQGAHAAKVEEGGNEAARNGPDFDDQITRKEAGGSETDRKESEKQKLLRQMKEVFAARKESGSFKPLNAVKPLIGVVRGSEPEALRKNNEGQEKGPADAIHFEPKDTAAEPNLPTGTADKLMIEVRTPSPGHVNQLKRIGQKQVIQLANNSIHLSRNPRDALINYCWINDVTFTEDGHFQFHIDSRKHFRKLAAETSWQNALNESISALRPSYKIIIYHMLPETLGCNLNIPAKKSKATEQLVRENSNRISTLNSPSDIRDIKFEHSNDSSRQRLAITLTSPTLARQTLTLGLIWNNEHHACEIPDLDPKALVRCGNCQHYGHLDFHCYFSPRCRNCAGSHKHNACTSPTIKCVLCGGPHAAARDDCPAKQAVKQRLRDAYLRQQEEAPPSTPSGPPKCQPLNASTPRARAHSPQRTHPMRLRSSPLKNPSQHNSSTRNPFPLSHSHQAHPLPTNHPPTNPKAEALLTQLERVKNSIFANRAALDESARRRIGKVVGDLRGVVLQG